MHPDIEPIASNLDDGEREGDIEKLLNSARAAVEQTRRNDPSRLAQSLAAYARLLARDGQYDAARKHAEEARELDIRGRSAVDAEIVFGICAGKSNQLEQAETHFYQAIDLARKIRYTTGQAQALQHLTMIVLFPRGQFLLAQTLIEEAASLLEEQGEKHWSESFMRGVIYQTIGDRRHCRQVLDEMVLRIEPGTRLAAAYYLIWARLTLDEEELEQANEYLHLGLRVSNRVGSEDLNLWYRIAFSQYYRLIRETAAARSWADDALKNARRYDSHYFIGLALIERAQLNWDADNQDAAEADLSEAQEILQPINAAYQLTLCRFLRALWYRQVGRPEAESAWLEAAKAIVREGYAFLLEKEQDAAFPLVAAHMRSKTPAVRAETEKILSHLANVPPPPLKVTALGQFAVWKGRRRILDQVWNKRKAGELFRFLLLQPGRTAGRDVIIEALWPDSRSDGIFDMLHQSTSALRHALEPDLPDKFPSRYVRVEGEQISLILPHGSIVDFEHFEQALPVAVQTRSADRLQEILNMCRGDLLPSDRYAEWSEEKRQSLSELRQRGLLALTKVYIDQKQYLNAIQCCRQILSIDEWNEDAVLLGMQAYAGLQDIPHALQIYLELEHTLKEELGIPPRADLRELAGILRNR